MSITFSIARSSSVLLRGLLVVVGMLAWQLSWGACSIHAGVVAQDIRMDMGRILIDPDLPVGAVIHRQTTPINARNNVGSCDWRGGEAIGVLVGAPTLVPGFNNVYATQVPGVGIRLYREAGSISTFYEHRLSLAGNTTLNLAGGSFQVELVKTAPQTGSGSVAPPGLFSTYYTDGTGPNRPILTSTVTGQGITVVTSTCQVEAGSRNILVDFGTVANSQFSGVGSMTARRDFQINLRCQGGNVDEVDQGLIKVRLDADADPSGLPGVLGITPGANAASRIGIHLADRLTGSDRPVVFGQAIELGRTPVNAERDFSLPMRAHYIQTESGTVGAGQANGMATFTIEYH